MNALAVYNSATPASRHRAFPTPRPSEKAAHTSIVLFPRDIERDKNKREECDRKKPIVALFEGVRSSS